MKFTFPVQIISPVTCLIINLKKSHSPSSIINKDNHSLHSHWLKKDTHTHTYLGICTHSYIRTHQLKQSTHSPWSWTTSLYILWPVYSLCFCWSCQTLARFCSPLVNKDRHPIEILRFEDIPLELRITSM